VARGSPRSPTRPHPALSGLAVSHDQPLAVLVALIDERRDVLIDLSPKRRGDHPPGALPSEIIQRDLQLLAVLPDGEAANIHHGVPSCRPSPASVFTTGKVRRLPSQANPQLLGIALTNANAMGLVPGRRFSSEPTGGRSSEALPGAIRMKTDPRLTTCCDAAAGDGQSA
jgi:hypothetical protein